jgi:hypothetical protein
MVEKEVTSSRNVITSLIPKIGKPQQGCAQQNKAGQDEKEWDNRPQAAHVS